MSDPEETAPFTHRPYGEGGDENPFVSPSGPAAQPSGPSYVQPPVPPPPTAWGQPPPGQWQQPWAYPAPYVGTQDHKGATTSLVLGIVSIVCLVLAFACCITIPGVLCAPFAWWTGAKAVREIDRSPSAYGNRTAAVTGMWMGAVMTFVGLLAVAGFVALIAFIELADPTLV